MHVDFTASGLILHPTQDKVLLIFHRKLQKRMQTGGHIDPEELPHEAAIREAKEETGLDCVLHPTRHSERFIQHDEIQPSPVYIARQVIPDYKDQAEHIHCDNFYILQATTTQTTEGDYNILDVKRFTPIEVLELGDQCFPSMHKVIARLFDLEI